MRVGRLDKLSERVLWTYFAAIWSDYCDRIKVYSSLSLLALLTYAISRAWIPN